MVIQDLTSSFSSSSFRKNKIAPVADRLLALFFDFVLFTPIFTLLFSPLFRRLEVRYYTSPESTEFLVLLVIAILGLAFATALTQAFFLSKFGYTPGKYIFKLRVISLESPNGKLGFTQALLRSGLWVSEFFMFCIPFVELFSHSQRQPLHDRAASTLVVTLKAQGDQGPHPLETHFVRNFLFLFVCVFLFWGAVVTTELYRMALRGDFKKQEVDSEQYLCQGVSLFAKKETNRLDLALARYLAKEVDEDCLLNEADFSLWTDHSTQRAWAYFAKGIYSQFDQEKANEYFVKTCSVDEKSEACDLAKALLGQNNKENRKKESLTARIFEIKELKAKGLFEQAQYRIADLGRHSHAFETFSQIERTQNLIGMGKIDEAKGAYENTWNHMSSLSRQHFSSWYCLEEVDVKCQNQHYSGCENLKSELQTSGYEDVNAEAVVALLSENECKRGNDLNMLALHFAIDADENLKKYVMAVSSESNWNQEAKISALRDLAFTENQTTRFLQRRAMISLLERSQTLSDFEKVASIIEKTKTRDWTLQKVAGVLMQKSMKSGFTKVAARATKLVPTTFVKTHPLQLQQAELRLPASEADHEPTTNDGQDEK